MRSGEFTAVQIITAKQLRDLDKSSEYFHRNTVFNGYLVL